MTQITEIRIPGETENFPLFAIFFLPFRRKGNWAGIGSDVWFVGVDWTVEINKDTAQETDTRSFHCKVPVKALRDDEPPGGNICSKTMDGGCQ